MVGKRKWWSVGSARATVAALLLGACGSDQGLENNAEIESSSYSGVEVIPSDPESDGSGVWAFRGIRGEFDVFVVHNDDWDCLLSYEFGGEAVSDGWCKDCLVRFLVDYDPRHDLPSDSGMCADPSEAFTASGHFGIVGLEPWADPLEDACDPGAHVPVEYVQTQYDLDDVTTVVVADDEDSGCFPLGEVELPRYAEGDLQGAFESEYDNRNYSYISLDGEFRAYLR